MQRENIVHLISEHKLTYETQALAYLLYFFSILREFVSINGLNNEQEHDVSLRQLSQMLHEDFIYNNEFKNMCLHSNNKEIHEIYNDLLHLVNLFSLFGDNSKNVVVNHVDAQIEKIYIKLVKITDSYSSQLIS